MSDTFDHEGDAWDSYEQGLEDQEPGYSSPRRFSKHDPLHYHQKISFKAMTDANPQFVRLKLMNDIEIWLPRKICKLWNTGTVYVHRNTYNTILLKERRK